MKYQLDLASTAFSSIKYQAYLTTTNQIWLELHLVQMEYDFHILP